MVDLTVYCPEEVLHAGGPLFGNTEEIQELYDAFVGSRLQQEHLDMDKCFICGYPKCNCQVCKFQQEHKGKASGTHQCALRHATHGGRPPKAGYYDKELKGKLLEAWQELGVATAPVFHCKCPKHHTGFYWPEELSCNCTVALNA